MLATCLPQLETRYDLSECDFKIMHSVIFWTLLELVSFNMHSLWRYTVILINYHSYHKQAMFKHGSSHTQDAEINIFDIGGLPCLISQTEKEWKLWNWCSKNSICEWNTPALYCPSGSRSPITYCNGKKSSTHCTHSIGEQLKKWSKWFWEGSHSFSSKI